MSSSEARKATHDKIRKAIKRLENGRPKAVNKGRKISIASVAEEAVVSRASIHNHYPDLLERIRGNISKHMQSQRDEKHQTLKEEREKNRLLRQRIGELNLQRNELASKNAALELERNQLQAVVESKNISAFKRK